MNSHNVDLSAFSKNWFWFFIWGIALLVLGMIAIVSSTLTTIITIEFLGILIFISGVVVIVDAFTFWLRKGRGFLLHLLIGILYCLVGAMFIANPILTSISLTFVLGIFYLVISLFRFYYAFAYRSPQWGWTLVNAIVTLILGILILTSWPASGLFIIGMFVGIDLLFAGWAYVIGALSVRSLA